VINGLLVITGSGQNASVGITNQPSVLYPALVVAAGQSFGALVIASGPGGLHQTITPPMTANLVLQTDGAGNLQFEPVVTSVPDPLSIGTLNLATALNVNAPATFNGTITSALVAGVISKAIGLDASNKFVTGVLTTNSKAWYYEAATAVSTAYPNLGLVNGQYCTIGNRLYDADGLINIQSGTTLALNLAGAYQIDWTGAFSNPLTGTAYPGISLVINGTVVNPGQQGLASGGATLIGNTTLISGTHIYAGAVNDAIQLQVINPTAGSSSTLTGLNLRNVAMTITKFK
jgi:hypothetical protein